LARDRRPDGDAAVRAVPTAADDLDRSERERENVPRVGVAEVVDVAGDGGEDERGLGGRPFAPRAREACVEDGALAYVCDAWVRREVEEARAVEVDVRLDPRA